MRVGMDGVLLGAWAMADLGVRDILDIGTGTGLLALMMAQRFPDAQVLGIDIEARAVARASENVIASPWHDRISILNQDIFSMKNDPGHAFDMIICNPPYYYKGYPIGDTARHIARDAISMPHDLLAGQVYKISTPNAVWSVIVPFQVQASFVDNAEVAGWYCQRRTDLITREGKAPSRSLLQFGKMPDDLRMDTLTVHSRGGAYTEAYKLLTGDFYLQF